MRRDTSAPSARFRRLPPCASTPKGPPQSQMPCPKWACSDSAVGGRACRCTGGADPSEHWQSSSNVAQVQEYIRSCETWEKLWNDTFRNDLQNGKIMNTSGSLIWYGLNTLLSHSTNELLPSCLSQCHLVV